MNADSSKKTALITGATSGIGYELVLCFAKDGYNLILIARDEAKLKEIAFDFSNHLKAAVTIVSIDLSLPNAGFDLYEKVKDLTIDVLVNNAGFAPYGRFDEEKLPTIMGAMRLNMEAVTEFTRLVLPQFIGRGSGKILNVASTAAFQPGPLMSVYYATKAYILSFSEGLRYELRGQGITVTTLCPGATNTAFQEKAHFGDSNLLKLGMMKASTVAKAGYKGLMKGKPIVIPGFRNKLGVQLIRFSPRWLVIKVVYKLNKTEKIKPI